VWENSIPLLLGGEKETERCDGIVQCSEWGGKVEFGGEGSMPLGVWDRAVRACARVWRNSIPLLLDGEAGDDGCDLHDHVPKLHPLDRAPPARQDRLPQYRQLAARRTIAPPTPRAAPVTRIRG
jgi:hypothetical protein